jgi:hypothetical protein
MNTTVGELKEQLRRDFERQVLSYLPSDNTVIEHEEAQKDRDDRANFLNDVFEIVSKLARYYPPEELAKIMGEQRGLNMLLSKWKYRIDILIQNYIK